MNISRNNTIVFSGWLAAIIIVAALFFVPGDTAAVVQGQCVNCHTMHNSQDGLAMVQPKGTEGDISKGGNCAGCHREIRDNLLTLSCIGCHAMDSNGNAIEQFDGFDVPQVAYTQGQGLAAGNFTYVFSNDSKGHNVHGFGADIGGDSKFGLPDKPPGWLASMDYSSIDFWSIGKGIGPDGAPAQILCAGAYGCHGNVNIKSQTYAVQGSHHTKDSILKFGANFNTASPMGTTSGLSYRFLSGVKGGEDDKWELASQLTTSKHNEYLGEAIADRTSGDDTQTPAEIDTMSEFCARCHGNFHMYGTGSGTGLGNGSSPWIRHPTDVALPSSTAPYSNYTDWELTAPIARRSIPAGSTGSKSDTDVGTPNQAIVFCLSCHRAHASEYDDSLRFSYSQIITGNGSSSTTGCFACHGDK